MLFGTPRKPVDGGEEGAYKPLAEGRPKGPETHGFPSPRTAMKEGLDATEIGSQMVAIETSKLSKMGHKGIACSGEKESTKAWHHILINRVRGVLGDVGVKILSKEGYTDTDLVKLEEWQVAYVHGIGNYLYGMILESIDREGKWGKALLTSVINADATIQGRAGRLVDHIIRAGTNMTIDQAKVRMMEI